MCLFLILSVCSTRITHEEIGAFDNPEINADSLVMRIDLLGFLPLMGQKFMHSNDGLDNEN